MVRTVAGSRFFRGLAVSLAVLGSAWAGTPASTCPADSFPEFVALFSDSAALQRSATSSPLHWQRLDLHGQPEPQPVLKSLDRSQVPFPVMPLAAERQQGSLVLDVGKPGKHLGTVILRKADTDYLVNYYFIKKACWSLVRIDDWSL